MNYRKLGKTGIKVSEIGFGCWQLGDTNWGGLVGKDAMNLVHKALDNGCNFFDTAPYYGEGNSEKILGDALKRKREKAVIVTKFGHNPQPPSNFSSKCIKQSVERSLKSLNTDYIDSVLLHNPPINILNGEEDHYQIFEELKKEGKIRSYGASIDSKDELEILLQQQGVEVAEIYMHALHQEIASSFKKVKENELGIIVKCPLDSGWLAGKYKHNTTFSTGFRERWSDEVKQRRFNLVEELRFLEQQDQTMAQGSLRFLLSYPEISTLIPGAKNIDQLLNNISSANKKLSLKEIQRVKNNWIDNISKDPLPW